MIDITTLSRIDLTEGAFAPGWKGELAHIGPISTDSPLVDMLSGKTTCATVALMAGVLLWGRHRIKNFTETDFCCELAEAAFAWHHSWRYVNMTAAPFHSPPKEPHEKSALFTLDNFLRKTLMDKDKWNSFYQPVMPLYHMCNVVNFILPKSSRPSFETWLSEMCRRLDSIAPVPDLDVPNIRDFESKDAYRAYCAPRRGLPLPPVVLDLDTDLSGVDLQAEADKFLQSLDHKKNRFLLSPDKLLEQGFDGLPYGRPT
ncbi:MAG: hypothetical protein RLZZ437_1482 [Pseudomonadota bacterium]|jgi:hypothetical protein